MGCDRTRQLSQVTVQETEKERQVRWNRLDNFHPLICIKEK